MASGEEEAERHNNIKEKKFCFPQSISILVLLRDAIQSLGVVYGDLGTSPLYVFYNIFPDGIEDSEDVIDALSMIIYTLTLIPLIKYVLVVCRANDNGQGGTFALYSVLCRHAKIRTIPNLDHTDEQLTTYSRAKFHERSFAVKTKRWLERCALINKALLVLVLVGSCMVIGDGILTPAISVLSAASGISLDPKLDPTLLNDKVVVLVAVAILVVLFSVQHQGIDKVGWLFAPVVFLWFLFIGGIGIFNIWKYDSSVLKAFSPVHVYRFFRKGRGWHSLGGVMLCITRKVHAIAVILIAFFFNNNLFEVHPRSYNNQGLLSSNDYKQTNTGSEALFADLSQFPLIAIQIAFTALVFPCLHLAYTGQAAYLMKNSKNVYGVFYFSIPDVIYWPAFVIANAAAVIASQATISATFSLIKQAVAHGCFPGVKVVHTSKKYPNHIYIPEINWILMILCIAVTAEFKNQHQIGDASGLAVVTVMLVTTMLMILIMILVWHCHWILVIIFTSLLLLAEGTYFSAMIFKVDGGGWVPLVIAASFFITMSTWHYVTVKRYQFEMDSNVSIDWILGLGPSLGLARVPGICVLYSELTSGVPHIFAHFITNLPAIHSVVVFVCVKYVPVYTVPEGERFLITRLGPNDFHTFQCNGRYGYQDLQKRDYDFEEKLLDSLFRFVKLESLMDDRSDSEVDSLSEQQATEHSQDDANTPNPNEGTTVSSFESFMSTDSSIYMNHIRSFTQMMHHDEVDDLHLLTSCRDTGVVHMHGKMVIMARKDSEIYKKIMIDYIYNFLSQICRENGPMFDVPHECLLNVGQVVVV